MKVKRVTAIFLTMVIAASMLAIPASAAGTKNEVESNNSMSQADRTYNDYNNYGTINPAGDEDWWVVSFPNSGSGSFWLGNIPSGHDFDLRVYDATGKVIAKSINNGNAQEYVCVDIEANKNYYVKIYGNGTGSSSQYLMRAKLYSWKDVSTPLYQQDLSNSCGAANMRMVLARYGIYVSELSVRERAEDMGGSYMDQTFLDDILNDFFIENSISTRYTDHYVYNISDSTYWSKITSNINAGKPMIVMLAYDDDHYFPNSSDGHYVTIRSYSPDSQTQQARINDSTRGNSDVRGIPLTDLNYYTRYPTGNCYFITAQW